MNHGLGRNPISHGELRPISRVQVSIPRWTVDQFIRSCGSRRGVNVISRLDGRELQVSGIVYLMVRSRNVK